MLREYVERSIEYIKENRKELLVHGLVEAVNIVATQKILGEDEANKLITENYKNYSKLESNQDAGKLAATVLLNLIKKRRKKIYYLSS